MLNRYLIQIDQHHIEVICKDEEELKTLYPGCTSVRQLKPGEVVLLWDQILENNSNCYD